MPVPGHFMLTLVGGTGIYMSHSVTQLRSYVRFCTQDEMFALTSSCVHHCYAYGGYRQHIYNIKLDYRNRIYATSYVFIL
jgi:hypothetical protein